MAERTRFGAPGLAGGGDGQVGSVQIDGVEADNRALHHLAKGAQILIATPGGGGYGPQKDRDNEHASRDKQLGYVEEDLQ
jgi:N-methylhydantoinase B/oxoprolinase/acetone carboxylase alpha subunit